MSKLINGVVKCNVEVFVIPNKARLAVDYINPEKPIENFRKLAELNHTDYDPEKDKLVQCWYVSKDDLNTENLGDHGAIVEDENGVQYIIHLKFTMYESLPETFFKGKSEGDIAYVKIPAFAINRNNRDEKAEIILDMCMKLNQTSYRYRRFGRFEEVLKKVCR